ncbi:hypothetical protein BGW36DRAFT_431062 [Talaromyces proteolyticus]|uniref:Mid2 domain-containing protein n=1 Tax=Talaromyces proteolyticus TaxID=1131652 RepID=A0AAD4PWB1_9EURO|nr:uncharacterized protein BGW36DRAFT_431062 [Talaromyces proteolyticus]KAH8691812.1 hypothetical protein BGW36DRAFT_431062 [Talaromyces proteolyticus]
MRSTSFAYLILFSSIYWMCNGLFQSINVHRRVVSSYSPTGPWRGSQYLPSHQNGHGGELVIISPSTKSSYDSSTEHRPNTASIQPWTVGSSTTHVLPSSTVRATSHPVPIISSTFHPSITSEPDNIPEILSGIVTISTNNIVSSTVKTTSPPSITSEPNNIPEILSDIVTISTNNIVSSTVQTTSPPSITSAPDNIPEILSNIVIVSTNNIESSTVQTTSPPSITSAPENLPQVLTVTLPNSAGSIVQTDNPTIFRELPFPTPFDVSTLFESTSNIDVFPSALPTLQNAPQTLISSTFNGYMKSNFIPDSSTNVGPAPATASVFNSIVTNDVLFPALEVVSDGLASVVDSHSLPISGHTQGAETSQPTQSGPSLSYTNVNYMPTYQTTTTSAATKGDSPFQATSDFDVDGKTASQSSTISKIMPLPITLSGTPRNSGLESHASVVSTLGDATTSVSTSATNVPSGTLLPQTSTNNDEHTSGTKLSGPTTTANSGSGPSSADDSSGSHRVLSSSVEIAAGAVGGAICIALSIFIWTKRLNRKKRSVPIKYSSPLKAENNIDISHFSFDS